MSVVCRYFSNCIVALLIVSNYERSLAAEAVGQKAVVVGTPTANLRTGAGVEHALKLTLKEGDSVTIEKLEGEWFWVTTPDSQQGYIHKNLLKPVDRVVAQEQAAPPQAARVAKPPAAPALDRAQTDPAHVTKAAKTPAPTAAPFETNAKATITDGKAPSLLQMLEGRESEVKIGLLVAAVAFVFGWFYGGHYYIRREHKYRRRLRL